MAMPKETPDVASSAGLIYMTSAILAPWTRPVLKAIQGAADMQRKIDNLTTQLAAFTDELSNLNPFLIAEATVKKAMALHSNNKAGKKVVQDALRAAKQD
ncbi:hypothetical protein AtubIFM55763_008823 [Aspergillus tubingensis]|nr:hypothetical protein AtubIFM55763_008823 [Aspergillus tubingensis]